MTDIDTLTPGERLAINDFNDRVAHALQRLRRLTLHRPRLLAAVSGGADSVALLASLAAVARRGACDVEAVHCNFHLRASESDRDADSVARLCADLGVPLTVLDIDIPAYRRGHPGVSVEMACRETRYDAFRRMMGERGLDRVAVAHHADDNAETLLLNLLRGAGSRGLKGMVEDTGTVWRPLLDFSRSETEAYVRALGLPYVTDSTNLKSEYRRNFLRLEVLPLLETRWPSARASLARSAAILAEENALLTATLDSLCPPGSRYLAYSVAERCVAPVTLLRHFIAPYGGTRLQAEEMARSCGRPGGFWRLKSAPGSREWGVYAMGEGWEIRSLLVEEPAPLTCQRIEMTPEAWAEMRSRRDAKVLYLPRPLEEYQVRTVREGDRIAPLGMKGSRLVSSILKDAGVPRERRASVRVVEAPRTAHLLWVEGLSRSRHDLLPPDAPTAYLVTT